MSSSEMRELMGPQGQSYFVHESSYVDEGAIVGGGTRVWHFSHVMKDCRIGCNCNLGQNVLVASGVAIGDNVKIQNNVSLYTGAVLEDDVFLGPSCVLTNVSNPRSQVVRHSLYETTTFRRGCTVGANATIVCGIELGRYCFIAAGTVVTRTVPDYALMMGVPARQVGWMSRHGVRLRKTKDGDMMVCAESGYRYREVEAGVLRCLDLSEDAPLPPDKAVGHVAYRSVCPPAH
jgi:UDP-2-acetamido-3-amino-2,3-dideoxy-glucuronate N-acetyltransferase